MSKENPLDLTDTLANMSLKQGISEEEAFKQIVGILAIKAEVYDIPQRIDFTFKPKER